MGELCMYCDVDESGFINYEEIIMSSIPEIVELAKENVSDSYDGVVQIGVDDGKLYGAVLQSNESENPKNRVVEVYRLESGFDPEDVSECVFCDCCTDDGHCCSEDKLDECCRDALVEAFRWESDDVIGDVLNEVEEYLL